jgi:exosome complex component RRP45
MAESHGVSQVQLSRLLDRSIRESDAIDTESLCIVSGEKVWLISCDVRVLDYSGGNVVDAALFAAMSAFKAFRKPEVSIISVAGKSTLRYYNRFVIFLHSSVLGTALTLV